jgi:hypothetical protein
MVALTKGIMMQLAAARAYLLFSPLWSKNSLKDA